MKSSTAKKIYQLIGYLISLAFIWLLVDRLDHLDLAALARQHDALDSILLVAALLAGYGLRTYRWSILLKAAGADYRFSYLYSNFIVSVGLNNILPLRAGDAYRVFGLDGGASKVLLVTSLIAERVFDLLSLIVLFCIWWTLSNYKLPVEISSQLTIYLSLIFIVGGACILLVHKLAGRYHQAADSSGSQGSLKRSFKTLIAHASIFFSTRVLTRTIPLSLLCWLPECFIFFSISSQIGLDLPFTLASMAHAVATLATVIPSAPGFFGTFHFAIFSLLSLAGIESNAAAAYSVSAHFFLWAPPVVFTAVFLGFKYLLKLIKASGA